MLFFPLENQLNIAYSERMDFFLCKMLFILNSYSDNTSILYDKKNNCKFNSKTYSYLHEQPINEALCLWNYSHVLNLIWKKKQMHIFRYCSVNSDKCIFFHLYKPNRSVCTLDLLQKCQFTKVNDFGTSPHYSSYNTKERTHSIIIQSNGSQIKTPKIMQSQFMFWTPVWMQWFVLMLEKFPITLVIRPVVCCVNFKVERWPIFSLHCTCSLIVDHALNIFRKII